MQAADPGDGEHDEKAEPETARPELRFQDASDDQRADEAEEEVHTPVELQPDHAPGVSAECSQVVEQERESE